ncbi:MAG: TonB-dependent receptor [Prevotella sp.]|nr:TonB-dependent receptor [Prevotella sp.]
MKKRLTMFFVGLFLCVGSALAQTKVSGTVLSQEDGQPIIGAAVKVVGTSTGLLTDVNGRFTLTLPEGKTQLEITYLGYEGQTVTAKNGMRVFLKTDAKMVDEVIVVAFGSAKKSAFTGSAKAIGSEELSQSQVTSVTNALAGAVPGVQLTSSSGDPSSTSTIRIRGFSSLNAGNDPLIIVDGAPYSGDLGNLNPNDVESMTVLKDAASNALYGARGANGVVMITTKKAKSGEATVTFDAKYGWNTRALQHYETIEDPAAYYEQHYAAYRNKLISDGYTPEQAWYQANQNLFLGNDHGGVGYNIWTIPEGQVLIGMNGKMNPNATLGRLVNYRGEDYWVTPDDWEDVGTRTGSRQEYNLSIAGSTEKSNTYVSLGYLKNEGITEKSDMTRLTARLKADYQAKKWLKVGANMSYARFEHNSLGNNGTSTSTANIWAFTSQMAPIYPAYVRTGDGKVKIDANGLEMMDYGEGMNAGFSRPFIQDANPIFDTRHNTRNFEGNAATGHGFADITILPGLVFTANATFNLDETRGKYGYNPYYGQFDSTGGTLQVYHMRTYDYNVQQLLNYNTTIAGVHNLGVMLGHEYYDTREYYLTASKSKMFSQENLELGGAVVDGQSAYSYKSRYNNEGFFGRAQYDYDTKYFFSASLRRDASSRFHPDYRWGTFWSVGAAWLINKEKFFNVSWVDELKVKASIGSQGNDNIGNYRYTDVFDIVNSGGNIGTSFATKGTKDISWETNSNTNIGVEFQLFKKLSGSIEWYYRKTTDMLYSFSVAPSLGYSSYYDNVGDLYNTGVEIDLSYNVIHTKDIDWDVHVNFATLKNRISKLHDDKKTTVMYTPDGKAYEGYNSGNFFITEDASMYTWYIKDYAGVNENGQAMWWKTVYETETVNGVETDVWYDRNGRKLESQNDDPFARRKFLKRETTTTYADADYYVSEESTVPPVYGGFGTTVKAYGFDFSINCSYQIGGKQYDGTYAQFMAPPTNGNAGYKFHKDILKSWTRENPSTEIPRWQFDDLYSSNMSTRFLTDGSYLNIENINLGYTFPKKWISAALLNSLRVYVSAENVFYWSKRKGFDPRQSYGSTTNATYYSPMRTVSGGITLTF